MCIKGMSMLIDMTTAIHTRGTGIMIMAVMPMSSTSMMIMITGTVMDELDRIGGRYGLITLCIGGGMGIATIIERI